MARGGARAEGGVGGLGRGSSRGRAETRRCHGSGWGRRAQRRPRSVTRGREPAAPSGASGPCCWAGRGGSTYLDHGRWVLKAWSHRWRGPAAGESSSASSGPGPRPHRACITKRHSEEGLKGEGSGRDEQTLSPGRPPEAGEDTGAGVGGGRRVDHLPEQRSEEGGRCGGREQDWPQARTAWAGCTEKDMGGSGLRAASSQRCPTAQAGPDRQPRQERTWQ